MSRTMCGLCDDRVEDETGLCGCPPYEPLTERAAATGCTGTHSYQHMSPTLDRYAGICPPSQRSRSCATSSAWVDAVGCTSLDAVQAEGS